MYSPSHECFLFLDFYQFSPQNSSPEIYSNRLNLLGSLNLFWRRGEKGFQLELSGFFSLVAGVWQGFSEDNLICAFVGP
jgi:hypothetical protein